MGVFRPTRWPRTTTPASSQLWRDWLRPSCSFAPDPEIYLTDLCAHSHQYWNDDIRVKQDGKMHLVHLSVVRCGSHLCETLLPCLPGQRSSSVLTPSSQSPCSRHNIITHQHLTSVPSFSSHGSQGVFFPWVTWDGGFVKKPGLTTGEEVCTYF